MAEKNPFDQFDAAPSAPPQTANPFDQFDAPTTAAPPTMHTLAFRNPKGKTITFSAPVDASDDDVRALAAKAGGMSPTQFQIVRNGQLTKTDTSAASGFGLGFRKIGDNIEAGIEKYVPGAKSLGDFLQSIGPTAGGPDADQVRAQHDAELANNTRTGFQTLGKIGGSALVASAFKGASLPVQGAIAGGVASDATTPGGTALDAGIGGIASYIGGKYIAPVVGKVAGAVNDAVVAPVVRAGTRLLGGEAAPVAAAASANPKAASILLKTLADQGHTPQEAAAILDAARGRGVPLALMDTGDEMRGLASGLARKPGPSRTMLRDVVIPRQDQQLDRVQDAIKGNLGDTANVRVQSEQMIKSAQAAAKPLYDKAYAAAPISSPALKQVLATPAGKQAINRAATIAANEMRDPKALGFVVGKDGSAILDPKVSFTNAADGSLVQNAAPLRQQGYSAQTLDYVKRGLDDIIEANRDPVTGRLKLDEAGRAVNSVRAKLLTELDKQNPDYAAARAAYAGPASAASALNKGAKFEAKDAETIMAETRDLNSADLEQYKLGVRSAISKQLEARTDASDKVKVLIGSPKKRMALAQLFGGEEKFGQFMDTLGDEGRAAATYARINTGSPTAANLADDANVDGLTSVAGNMAVRALKGHGIISNGIATIGDLAKYGSGKAGERTRAELAATLSETDPVALQNALNAATRSTRYAPVKTAGRKAVGAATTISTLGALSSARGQ